MAEGQLDVLAARLAEAGAPVRWDDELPGIRRFYSEDPWGNRLELLTPIRASELGSPEHVFAGVAVRDFGAALPFYERLLGRAADFHPHDTEAMWQLREGDRKSVV